MLYERHGAPPGCWAVHCGPLCCGGQGGGGSLGPGCCRMGELYPMCFLTDALYFLPLALL